MTEEVKATGGSRQRIVPQVVEERFVVLELSEAHAQAVYDILMNVAGSPIESRRGLASAVLDALRPYIVDEGGLPADMDVGYPGGISFRRREITND